LVLAELEQRVIVVLVVAVRNQRKEIHQYLVLLRLQVVDTGEDI
jgi:hypothetical protein